MKKVLVIILSFSILGGSIHADELSKLPMLLKHLKEHKKQHPADSSVDFIFKHSITFQKAESKKDQRSDSKLPNKSSHNFHAHFSPFVCEHTATEPHIRLAQICHFTYYNATVLSRSADKWQPPQL